MLMPATVSPIRRRASEAPPQPESLEMTRAKRSSWAPAQRAVLPSREWPSTATCRASTSGSVSR